MAHLAPPGWDMWEAESDSEILGPPTHFAAPKTAEDVQKAKDDAVPKGTNEDTEWCLKPMENVRAQYQDNTKQYFH